jgi:hypothetical protein
MAKVLSIEEHRRKAKQLPITRLKPTIHFHPLPWEDPVEIEAMIADLEQRFPPQDVVERCMLNNLIHDSWRLRRYQRLRAPELEEQRRRLGLNGKSLERSIALAQRMYASSLRMLQQTQTAKKKKRGTH